MILQKKVGGFDSRPIQWLGNIVFFCLTVIFNNIFKMQLTADSTKWSPKDMKIRPKPNAAHFCIVVFFLGTFTTKYFMHYILMSKSPYYRMWAYIPFRLLHQKYQFSDKLSDMPVFNLFHIRVINFWCHSRIIIKYLISFLSQIHRIILPYPFGIA